MKVIKDELLYVANYVNSGLALATMHGLPMLTEEASK